MTRIATSQVWRSSIDHVMRGQVRQDEVRSQISSGRRINRASDDPVGAVRSTQLRADADAIDQYHRAADDAVAVMGAQDNALQSILSRLTVAEELTISSANDIQTADGREAIATELEELRDQLVDLANTSYRGRSLFGGHQATAVDASGVAVTLVSDSGSVLRRIDGDEVIQVNVDAADFLGFGAGRDLFAVIDDIVADVRANDVPTLGTTRLDELDQARSRVSHALGTIGARSERVEQSVARSGERRDGLRIAASGIEDVDLAAASVALSEATLAYEAALAVTARLNGVTLLNYM